MKRIPGNTINHTISKKGSMLEFEKWFVKEYGKKPIERFYPFYTFKKSVAKKAWLAREKVY